MGSIDPSNEGAPPAFPGAPRAAAGGRAPGTLRPIERIEDYGVVMAHVRALGDVGAALSALEVSMEDWQSASRWTAALSAEALTGATTLAIAFGGAFAAERRRLAELGAARAAPPKVPPIGTPLTRVPPDAATGDGARPVAGGLSLLGASNAAAVDVDVRPVEPPLVASAPMESGAGARPGPIAPPLRVAPLPLAPPPVVVSPRSVVDVTAPESESPDTAPPAERTLDPDRDPELRGALPFHEPTVDGAAPAAAEEARSPGATDEESTLAGAPALRDPLPFAAPLPMTLEGYAWLCASLGAYPTNRPAVFQQYRVRDDAHLEAIHGAFRRAFERDVPLYQTFRQWQAEVQGRLYPRS